VQGQRGKFGLLGLVEAAEHGEIMLRFA